MEFRPSARSDFCIEIVDLCIFLVVCNCLKMAALRLEDASYGQEFLDLLSIDEGFPANNINEVEYLRHNLFGLLIVDENVWVKVGLAKLR